MAVVLNNRAVAALKRALHDVPGVFVAPRNRGDRLGVELQLQGSKPLRLNVLWLSEGWPSDVKHALARTGLPTDRLVIAAPALSTGAIDELRKRGINWVDELGNVRLVVPPRLALVKTALPSNRVPPSFAWSPSKVAIAEILLSEARAKHKLKSISSRTDVSVPQVSNVLRAFDKQGWTERHGPLRGAGVWREVAKPGSMLESWTAHLSGARPRIRSGHRVFREAMQFLEQELAPVLRGTTEWAVTGWAGASIVAPSTTFTPVLQVYFASSEFDALVDRVFESAKIRPVDSGSNIEFWRAEEPLVLFSGAEQSIPVVSSPRLYSDLMSLGGRGVDAARNVRESVIGY
jgi:hypothetical protein